ncbi:hypothetical protein Pfo_012379 [Paulownia fortunei]|nr:hypothetical protein Pfo_012379 [Paulownia fortunei]
MQKEVKRFELNLSVLGRYHSSYEFPKVEKLLSRSHEVKFAFGFLRSLRLVDVDIKDEVVQYFLASCLYLEQLCISASFVTKNLQVVDPLPNLKVLEISECLNIQSLEISAMSLVSFTYEGNEISLPFKKIPNLSELTLGGNFCKSFIYEPNKHSSYSVQLVKLALNLRIAIPERAIIAPPALPQLYSLKRLELNIVSKVGRSLRFFTSLIKASPFLNEFRIKISYMVQAPWDMISLMQFPEVSAAMAPLFYRFYHKNLKTVEMAGYIGCSSDNNFLLQLFKIAPSLETVVIDTRSEYYEQELGDCYTMCTMKKVEGVPCICKKQEIGARTRMEAKKRAKYLESCISRETVLVIT